MANVIVSNQQRPETPRALRFMLVGLSGTAVDFAVLTVLKELFGFPILLANSLSFGAGVVNNFTWNRLWTFSDKVHSNVTRQFVQFLLVSVVGLILSNIIVLTLSAPLGGLFGVESYGYIPAKVVATVLVFVWNFNANRLWTFQTHAKESGS